MKHMIGSSLAIASLMIAGGLSSQATPITVLSDDFTSSSVTKDGNMRFDEIAASGALGAGAWRSATGSNWNIANGAGGSVSNAARGTNAQNEGVLGRVVDVSAITDTSLTRLRLNVDFSTVSATERLFVHVRGYIRGTDPAASAGLVNMGATNGNAWHNAFGSTDWTTYNLNSGQLNDHASNFSSAGFAQQVTDGVAGAHTFSTFFDMSGYATEADDLAGFDYVAVFVTRDSIGTTPEVTISNISLTAVVPEPTTFALLAWACVLIRVGRRRFLA